MSKMVSIIEFDIVFISYDEPNADENYNDLIEKAPAKRSFFWCIWESDAHTSG